MQSKTHSIGSLTQEKFTFNSLEFSAFRALSSHNLSGGQQAGHLLPVVLNTPEICVSMFDVLRDREVVGKCLKQQV